MSKNNILITGPPGIGKTTAIIKISNALSALKPAGFYTEEIRERGARKGFELVSIGGGQRAVLSHVDIKGAPRVGRYGVDIAAFESFLDSLPLFDSGARLMVIDEIGKMECFSDNFNSLMKELLEHEVPLIASIALKGGGLISEIKSRDDVTLYRMDATNRDELPDTITGRMKAPDA